MVGFSPIDSGFGSLYLNYMPVPDEQDLCALPGSTLLLFDVNMITRREADE